MGTAGLRRDFRRAPRGGAAEAPAGAAAAGAEAGVGLGPADDREVLPPAVRATYAQAFTEATGAIFLVAGVMAVVGFALSWLLPERTLRETIAAASAEVETGNGRRRGDAVAPESQVVALVGLTAVDRDVRQRHTEQIVGAGRRRSAAAAWLLVRLGEQPQATIESLGRYSPFGAGALQRAAEELIGPPD